MMTKHFATAIMLPILIVASAGCGKSAWNEVKDIPDTGLSASMVKGEGCYWQSVRFKIAWLPETVPRWSLGLLLADRVVEPVLMQFHNKIYLWRFHRRAVRDGIGHQFSFIFYADSSVAADIFKGIGQNPILEELVSRAFIEEVLSENTPLPSRHRIEAFSDSDWSIKLQKAWPGFIMGVSAMWLELINQHVDEKEIADRELDDLIKRYQTVDESINMIWSQEGQHAFFHHLNAIFGYKPLIIRNRMNF
jgi:hypothetical protein